MRKIALFLFLIVAASIPAFAEKTDDLFSKGNQYVQERNYEKAAQEFEEILKTDSNNSRANLLLGLTYANLHQNDKAVQYANKAVELEPSYAAYFNLGLVYASIDKPELALSAFDEALTYNPKSYQAEYQKGIVYLFQKKYDEAKKAFEQSIEFNPDFQDAHIGLTGSLYKSGKKSEALDHIQKLKDMDRKDIAKALEDWIKKQESKPAAKELP